MGRARLVRPVALLAPLFALGCGPWGPLGVLAGGPFLGRAEPAPADWSFSDAHPLVAVETRRGPWRHTVTVLCVTHEGRLYLMARHAPRKRWVRNLMDDPRIRVEIGGRLFAARARRTTDPFHTEAAARGFLRKYVGIDPAGVRALSGPPPEGDDRAEVWTFVVERPDDGPGAGA